MADFDLPNIAKLTRGVSKIFNDLQSAPEAEYKTIATVNVTKSHTVDYAWLGDVPKMSEWIDARSKAGLKDYTYAIAKKDWEASITVKRDDFVFDNLNLVKPKIQQLSHAVIEHYNDLVYSLIPTNGVCYDGQPFFGEHAIGKVKYSNKTTAKLTTDALFAAITAMTTIKTENGKRMKIKPNLLLIAPNLLQTAKTILGAKTIEGTDNIAANLLELKVVHDLPTNAWCVLDTTQPLKPFILQISKTAKLEADTSKMFDEKQVYYGVDTMDNAGYGFWQMAYYSDGSAKSA